MFQYQTQQNELQLQDISQYVNRIEQLVNFFITIFKELFLHNVSLQIPNINRRQVFSDIATQMNKSFSSHDLKVVKLWIMFLARMDAANFGVTIIHVTLLQFLVNKQLFKYALKFVSTLRLPLIISLAKYRQYLLLSAQVYLEYQDYSQALQALNVANSIEQRRIQPQFLTLKMLILTSLIINRQVQKNIFIRDLDKIKISCKQQIQEWINDRPQKIGQLQFQVNMFANICESKPLRQEQLRYLQRKGLLQLYLKSQSSKVKQLRKYIQKDIYNPILYRIKCTQIKNQQITQFQTVKSLNFPSVIFKYDKKNSIMYFNHGKISQQELNEQIDKICEMQEVIRTRPNIKFEQQMEIDRYDADEMEEERRPVGGFLGRMVGGFFGRR